jgi:hypothetical protein
MIKKIFSLLLLLLTACGTTVTPVSPSATPPATEIAVAAPTAVFILTNTAVPATLTPAPSATAVPTARATEEDILYSGESPDGAWNWAVLSEWTPHRTLVTRFTSADGKTEWRISPSPDDPLGMEFQSRLYRPFFWLSKEPYVYLVGDGCCVEDLYVFERWLALARLDLTTGKVVPWPVSYNWVDMYTFSFSPSEEYLLSGGTNLHSVQITALRDGATQTISLPESFDEVGKVTWSQDGQSAAMMVCKDLNYGTICSAVALIVVRAGQAEFSTVVSDWIQALDLSSGGREEGGFAWTDDTHLTLSGPKYTLVYNTETGGLSKR